MVVFWLLAVLFKLVEPITCYDAVIFSMPKSKRPPFFIKSEEKYHEMEVKPTWPLITATADTDDTCCTAYTARAFFSQQKNVVSQHS